MSDVSITGTFTGLSVPEVCELVRRFAVSQGHTPTLIKVSSEEADYEDALLEAFIQPILDDAFISIEAGFRGSMTTARRWLDAFIDVLEEQGIHADFDLLEQDEAGKMLGEMISLRTAPSPPRSEGADTLLPMSHDQAAESAD